MSGIVSKFRDIYIKFLVWLGAAPPEGYEDLAPDVAVPAEYTLQAGETIYAVGRRFKIDYKRIARPTALRIITVSNRAKPLCCRPQAGTRRMAP